jgi:DGQHR domain-containing protein
MASDLDPLLPTSALLSAREGYNGILKYEPISEDADGDIGFITLTEGRRIYIVDYQHRMKGLELAIDTMGANDLRDFQIPFVLMANATHYEEIRQFFLINTKQKRVDTDLALALMQTMASEADEAELINLVGPGNRYKIRASRMTFKIAALESGVWTTRIQEPNNPTPEAVVRVKSFVDSLRPMISTRSVVHDRSDDDLVQIISSYWMGISLLVPTAFQSPTEFSIQRAIGLYVMHRVAAERVLPICVNMDDFSSANVANILRGAQRDYLNEQFWKTGGPISAYSSGSGQAALADLIMDSM